MEILTLAVHGRRVTITAPGLLRGRRAITSGPRDPFHFAVGRVSSNRFSPVTLGQRHSFSVVFCLPGRLAPASSRLHASHLPSWLPPALTDGARARERRTIPIRYFFLNISITADSRLPKFLGFHNILHCIYYVQAK